MPAKHARLSCMAAYLAYRFESGIGFSKRQSIRLTLILKDQELAPWNIPLLTVGQKHVPQPCEKFFTCHKRRNISPLDRMSCQAGHFIHWRKSQQPIFSPKLYFKWSWVIRAAGYTRVEWIKLESCHMSALWSQSDLVIQRGSGPYIMSMFWEQWWKSLSWMSRLEGCIHSDVG